MRNVQPQFLSCKAVHMASDSIYNSEDKDCLVTFITTVNPSDILVTMVSFDNNKEPIVACWIWILWCHPGWEKGF
jgi:hypothetical protein